MKPLSVTKKDGDRKRSAKLGFVGEESKVKESKNKGVVWRK